MGNPSPQPPPRVLIVGAVEHFGSGRAPDDSDLEPLARLLEARAVVVGAADAAESPLVRSVVRGSGRLVTLARLARVLLGEVRRADVLDVYEARYALLPMLFGHLRR